MKVSTKKISRSNPVYSTTLFHIECDRAYLIIHSENHSAIIEGDILRIKEALCNNLKLTDIEQKLSTLLAYSPQDFTSHLEGIFIIAIHSRVDNDLHLYRSPVQTYDIYYSHQAGNYLVSNDIEDFENQNEYSNFGLASILSEGYCPDKNTIFSSIKRIAHNEYLHINDHRLIVKSNVANLINADSELQLEEYYETYESAVLSRTSSVSNWVEVSGGWDSTTVLGTLCRFESADIHAVTTSITLTDQQNFNYYEVEKAKQIASYYNIPLTIAEYNLTDKKLIDSFIANKSFMNKHQIYESQALWRPVMYQKVNQLAAVGSSCFNSLFADTIFNFGCSQYVTIMENSYVFREFVDKMATYLYGPTFVKKIIDNNYNDDYIYNFFKWHNKANESDLYKTTDKDRIAKYLLSFIYGKLGKSVPFSKTAVNDYLTESASIVFEDYLYKNYIQPLSQNLTSDNIYFILLELYKHFYLQGGEQKQPLYGLATHVKSASPFLDSKMLALASKIPEEWGRGVSSWSRTKYPLKSYTDNKINFPHSILSESKHHAYLHESETGKQTNFNYELLYNSVYSDAFFNNISDKTVEDNFDDNFFDIQKLKQLAANKQDTSPLKRRLFIYLAANSD